MLPCTQAEKAKERKWKGLAQEYREQVEEDKGSAESAMKKLEDALKYMNSKVDASDLGWIIAQECTWDECVLIWICV